jgi:hypothetical protein
MHVKAIRYLAIGLAAFVLGSCQTPGRASSASLLGLSVRQRQARFIEKGYESAYSARDNGDYKAYIKLHGAPDAITREPSVNRHDQITDEMLTLRYPGYEMRYLVYSPRKLWHPPESLLMAVLSRSGGRYLFGIAQGMDRGAVREILGPAGSAGSDVEVYGLNGHRVFLTFKDEALLGILWDFSGD